MSLYQRKKKKRTCTYTWINFNLLSIFVKIVSLQPIYGLGKKGIQVCLFVLIILPGEESIMREEKPGGHCRYTLILHIILLYV